MARSNGKITSLAADVVQMFAHSVSNIGNAWFGPSQPLEPVAPKEQTSGRQFDYATSFNVNSRPRQGEALTYDHLRAFADNYDLLRIIIETRKDQMAKLPWVIRLKDKPNTDADEALVHDARCEELTNFFAFPDKEHSWDAWLRMLLEDLLVIDAPVVYTRRTRGGEVYAVEPIDGATIKRVLDIYGRTPLPPEAAYQQILKGLPAVNYTRDELIYLPRNPRTHKVYGFSPVEQIVTTINIALRRQAHQLGFYTDGSTPDLIFQVPAEWTPEQIKRFEDYWNSLLSGNIHERRKTRFVPQGVTPFDTKDKAMKDEYDEWIARIVCFAFSISPQAFVKEMNRATAQTAQEAALAEGLAPLMLWVKSLMDRIIQQVFGYLDIEFKWDTEESAKPKEQAEIDKIYVDAKVLHPDEVRAERFNMQPMDPALRSSLNPAPLLPQPQQVDESKPTDEAKEKFAKSKKYVAPIDREREKVEQVREQLKQQIHQFFQEQAKDVAIQVVTAKDQLGKSIKDNVSNILDGLSFGAWSGIAAWISDLTSQLAVDGVEVALTQINAELEKKALNLANEQAIKFAEDRAAELVGMIWRNGVLVENPSPIFSITESTREMLRATITQALEEGWSNDKLADEIGNSHAFSEDRAEMIARTETAIADVQGNMIAYKAAGVESKEWMAAPDCCDACQELDGKIIPINESFVAGSYFKDAPLHPHCRCDTLPVVT